MTFRYTVSEKAVVTFRIRRCHRMPRSARGRRACIRYALVKTFTRRSKAGRNATRYRGAKRLPRGSYRADVMATDSAGNRSRVVRVRFRLQGPAG